MIDKKIIVVNGIQRGGTNVVWNILQSHPDVCAPRPETGRLLHPTKVSSRLWRYVIGDFAATSTGANMLGKWADRIFYRHKMAVLQHPDDRSKAENVTYTAQEVADSILCIKSVNQDIKLVDFFHHVYRDCYFVGVIRNGYAMCDSWVRRGRSAKTAGKYYAKYVGRMLSDSQKYEHYELVKFEDVLQDPFGTARQLYTFADLVPTEVEKLKLKSKEVFNAQGQHKTRFGELKRKYWFSPDTVFDLIDPNVSNVQAQKLTSSDRQTFYREASSVLKHFNYE